MPTAIESVSVSDYLSWLNLFESGTLVSLFTFTNKNSKTTVKPFQTKILGAKSNSTKYKC